MSNGFFVTVCVVGISFFVWSLLFGMLFDERIEKFIDSVSDWIRRH